MKDFVIITDSSGDLPVAMIEQHGIVVVPMTITVNENTYKHYHDYRELSKIDYYNALRNGATGTTSGANTYDIFNTMKKIAEEEKDILYLSLSSGLSCSYQNAVFAADLMKESYPNTDVEIIDSKSVCVGVGLLLILAARAKERGCSLSEVIELVNEKIKNIKHHFTVNDLSALSRSGRISHLTAMTGSLLNLKPMLTIDSDGRVQSSGKVRGRKAAIRQLIDNTVKSVTDTSLFVIAHADAIDEAEAIKNSLSDRYPGSEVIISDVGPMIGIHVGIETLAVICV